MNSAQLLTHNQKSCSRCGYSVRLLAFVLSRWKNRVSAWPVSMTSR